MSQDPGTWRASFDVSLSHGLTGGHAESHGLAPDGRVVEITPHRHAVELNLTRFELGLSRTFNETWDVAIRVPYFIKEQHAEEVRQVLPEAEIRHVDGELCSWYGSRLRHAPSYLQGLLA